MVNIIIFDNDGNELYRFRNVPWGDVRSIIHGAVMENDHQVLIEREFYADKNEFGIPIMDACKPV